MAFIGTGQVGPQVLQDGTSQPLRQDRSGALCVVELHGRYFEQGFRGNVFSATNQSATAVSVALATAYTGLVVSNPLGNTKNLSILTASFAISVSGAAISSIHLIGGYSSTGASVVHTSPLPSPGIQNNLIGVGAPSTAKADISATLTGPNYVLPLMGGFTAALFPASPMAVIDLGGQLVIPPGGYVAIGALTALSGFGGFVWEEVPI